MKTNLQTNMNEPRPERETEQFNSESLDLDESQKERFEISQTFERVHIGPLPQQLEGSDLEDETE